MTELLLTVLIVTFSLIVVIFSDGENRNSLSEYNLSLCYHIWRDIIECFNLIVLMSLEVDIGRFFWLVGQYFVEFMFLDIEFDTTYRPTRDKIFR